MSKRCTLSKFCPNNNFWIFSMNFRIVPNESYLNYLYNLESVSSLISKRIPGLRNRIPPDCQFQLFVDSKSYNDEIISEKSQRPIKLKFNFVPNHNNLRLRMFLFDYLYPENTELDITNKISIEGFEDTKIFGINQKIYADERPAYLIPYQEEITLKFLLNHPFFMGKNRCFVPFIIILEDINGFAYAQRFVKFRIVEKPDRPIKLFSK